VPSEVQPYNFFMRDLSAFAFKILRKLSFPRLAGSEGEEMARDIISDTLRGMDLPVKEESFELWTFKPGDGRINIKGKVYDAIPYGNSKPFKTEGEIAYVEDIEYVGREIKGKIVLTYGGVGGSMYEKFLDKGAKGIVSISPPEKGFSFSSISQRFAAQGKILPALIIDYDTGLKIKEYEGNSLLMEGNTESYKGSGVNVVTEIEGSRLPEEVILVCGHYDSVAISPGATDNGGGSAIMLSLAKYFSVKKPDRTLRFVWFSGEELGLVGSQAYVENIKDEIKKIKMVVNIDVAGDPIGENVAMCISERDTLNFVSFTSREKGIPFKTRLDIYSSDSMPFALYGVPSINLARFGGKGSFYIHTHNDKVGYVSSTGLSSILEMALGLVDRLDKSIVFPLERKISRELKEKIEEYFMKRQGKKVEVKWE